MSRLRSSFCRRRRPVEPENSASFSEEPAKISDLSENERGSCGWRRAGTLDDAQRE